MKLFLVKDETPDEEEGCQASLKEPQPQPCTFPGKDHLTKTSARAVVVPTLIPVTENATNAFNTFKNC